MISLIIPPKYQISRVSGMLTQEYGTAANIKSRVNRQSVQAAIQSAQARLKLYNRAPTNGLALFVGTVLTDENKEKKITIDFEPHKPLARFIYLCDNKFHTDSLSELLESESSFGFIIMDGSCTLLGILAGNTRQVLCKFSVDLPKKHGRGGQSAARFSRLRDEKRHNYIRKVAELAVEHFITDDKVNVTGLVLGGSADFKTELAQSDLFDPRLSAKIIKIVDLNYGGENGFNQAIDLAADSLAGVKFVQEKRLIQKYFDEINQDTGKYCYGVADTMKALELGAVETLMLWENLDITRYILRNAAGDELTVYSNKSQETDKEQFVDKSTGTPMEQAAEPQPLVDWLAENYRKFGTDLQLVTDKSQEGTQFVKGLGGIGGLLRYKIDLQDINEADDEDEFFSDEEDI